MSDKTPTSRELVERLLDPRELYAANQTERIIVQAILDIYERLDALEGKGSLGPEPPPPPPPKANDGLSSR